MAKLGDEFDITKNIKLIEIFKSQLLNSVADLYTSLLNNNSKNKERADVLANIIINTYLLSDKLGIGNVSLDQKVLSRIKLGILEDMDNDWKAELNLLSKHIDKYRDL